MKIIGVGYAGTRVDRPKVCGVKRFMKERKINVLIYVTI
jgi:hypothetical protein